MNLSTPQEIHLPRTDTLRIVAYFFVLNLFVAASNAFTFVPISWFLKEGLHLQAQSTSLGLLLMDSPYFIGFIFGFLRDRWRPFGMEDRGYFLLVPPLKALALASLALGSPSYARLVTTMVISTCGSVLLGAALGGLLAAVSRRYGMTGRLSVVYNLAPQIPSVLATAAGPWVLEHLGIRATFVSSALLILPVSLLAFWTPSIVYAPDIEKLASIPENVWQALRRLTHTRVVYLPAAILFLFCFMPGWNTPLFYYLTDSVGLSPAAFGASRSFGMAGNALLMLAYDLLCHRFNLRFSLFLGTTLVVLGGPLYFLVRTPYQAYAIQFITGASLGIAYAAFFDLLARCCPKHLEGAAFMLAAAGMWVASDVADVLGGWLYQHGGFLPALLITSLTSTMIFPILFFIPKRLTSTHDGQRVAEADEEEKLEGSSGMKA